MSRAYACFALVHFQDLHKENVENDLQASLTSRSLDFFIELRAEVDHTNVMS